MKQTYTMALLAATLITCGVQAQSRLSTSSVEDQRNERGASACDAAQLIYMVPPPVCMTQPTQGNNAGAPLDYVESACEPLPFNGPSNWYKFHSGNHTQGKITVAPTAPNGRDWGFVVYDDCQGTEVACGLNSTDPVTVDLLPGRFYYMQVYSNLDYGTAGAYLICVRYTASITAPVNDNCNVPSSALSVGTPLTFTGTTVGATIDNDFAVGSTDYASYGTVWHSFTTTECTDVIVSYCGTDPTMNTVWIILATACPEGSDHVFTSDNDISSCGDGNFTLFFNELPAGTYLIPVLSSSTNGGESWGPYVIHVSAAACATTGIPENGHDGLSVYPNPSDGNITVRTDKVGGEWSIELLDMTGRTVHSEYAHLTGSTGHALELKGKLATGAYTLRLTNAEGTISKQVMVQ